MRLTGRKQEPGEVYKGLRQQVLRLTPEQVGDAFADAPILAVLMETGYEQAVATLVGVVHGTSSLYLSNGGEIQVLRDRTVRPPLRDQREHRALALAQLVERRAAVAADERLDESWRGRRGRRPFERRT